MFGTKRIRSSFLPPSCALFGISIFHAAFLLPLALGDPIPSTGESCTPTSVSEACRKTSGCPQEPTPAPTQAETPGVVSHLASILSSSNYRYSLEHVAGVMDELKDKVTELKGYIFQTMSSWESSHLSVAVGARGLTRLYPIHNDSPDMDEIHPDISHSTVLAEMRWWLTAAEEHAIQVEATGLLGPVVGPSLVNKISWLSRDLNSLLNLLDISSSGFSTQARCAQVPRTITDSTTKRARYTSVALRDLNRAFIRIKNVLSACSIQRHTEGRHLVKLHCPAPHHHLFYHHLPSNIHYLYSHSQFLNNDA